MAAQPVNISRAQTNIVVAWPDPTLSLGSAPELFGPWTFVPATNPFAFGPVAPRQFFRLLASSDTNHFPSVAPDMYVAPHDREFVAPAPGVLENDGDVNVLAAVVATPPAHCTLALS